MFSGVLIMEKYIYFHLLVDLPGLASSPYFSLIGALFLLSSYKFCVFLTYYDSRDLPSWLIMGFGIIFTLAPTWYLGPTVQ